MDETITCSNECFENLKRTRNINFSKRYVDKWTKEECEEFLSKYEKYIIKNAKLKEGVKSALKKLHKDGHYLVVITARNNKYFKDTEKLTLKMFEDNNMKFDEIYFDQKIKSDIAKRLNIDLMIDDSINVYNNMKKENIDCILFGHKIKTWKEILDYIESRKTDG